MNTTMDVLDPTALPEYITTEEQLEDLLSTPDQGLVDDFAQLEGDIMVLGVGGKVGPTLARMAKRAAPHKRVIGVARFSDPEVKQRLESWGVETHSANLLDFDSVKALPKVKNIVFMAGKKFGTVGDEPYTWAMNAVAPTLLGETLHENRFVAFSTLCVYPFSNINGPGSQPDKDRPTPLGEYANSCVARERVFQYYSERSNSPGRLARLNYAIDLRYGAIHDIGLWVYNRQPIDIRTAVANCIWQGESTSHILRCLCHGNIPATAINIGKERPAVVRDVAMKFGEIFGIEPIFKGEETDTAWYNDTSEAIGLFGPTQIDIDTMIRWNAWWLQNGGVLHNKPTHYEERAGSF
jgi:nucleoside-diphosphate-sugar epimerase